MLGAEPDEATASARYGRPLPGTLLCSPYSARSGKTLRDSHAQRLKRAVEVLVPGSSGRASLETPLGLGSLSFQGSGISRSTLYELMEKLTISRE